MNAFITNEEILNIKSTIKSLNEKSRRQFLYKISHNLGRGGASYVAKIFHISRMTINKAKLEIENNDIWYDGSRIRKVKSNFKNKIFEEVNNVKEFTKAYIDSLIKKTINMSNLEKATYIYKESKKLGKYKISYLSKTFHISRSVFFKVINEIKLNKNVENVEKDEFDKIIEQVKKECGEDKLLTEEEIENFLLFVYKLNEQERRLFFYLKSLEYGSYGMKYISYTFHISMTTLRKARDEYNKLLIKKETIIKRTKGGKKYKCKNRVRKVGGGRKSTIKVKRRLLFKIKKLVNGETYGNPMSLRKWTTLSLRKIQKFLKSDFGITVGLHIIQQALKELGYSRQKNVKFMQVGKKHKDRDTQFKIIEKKKKEFIESNDPIISIDCLKKFYLGNYASNGTEIRLSKNPRKTNDHDFPDKNSIKAIPYGVYDVSNNEGFINLGISHDTSEFAANSIILWWNLYGKFRHPNAKRILILSDGGGSNRYRGIKWKEQLAFVSLITGLEIHVSHYPTGCSKYNLIEHRYFSFISINWQGQPKTDLETTKKFIEATTTSTGLRSHCHIDENEYALNNGIFSNEEFLDLNIIPDEELGSWNYTINEVQ